MERKEKYKAFFIVIGITIAMITGAYFTFKLQTKDITLLMGAGFVFIPSLLGVVFSNKTGKVIDKIKEGLSKNNEDIIEIRNTVENVVFQITEKDIKDAEKFERSFNGINDIRELMSHEQEMISLCQAIESETSKIFERSADINIMLRDYIIGVNDIISEIIEKQYSFDLNRFDTKYFRSKILNRINHLSETIDFKKLDEVIFEQINDKIIRNIKGYIGELKYIKDLENGKRRDEFKKLTLKLTKQITNHSIDIFKQKTA